MSLGLRMHLRHSDSWVMWAFRGFIQLRHSTQCDRFPVTDDIIVQRWKGKPAWQEGWQQPGLPLPPQQGSILKRSWKLTKPLFTVCLTEPGCGRDLACITQNRGGLSADCLASLPARVNLCAWPWEPQTRQLASLASSLWIFHIYVSAVTLLVSSCCQVFLLRSISPRVSSPSAPKGKQTTDKPDPGRRFWREAGHLPTCPLLRAMTGSPAMINTAKKIPTEANHTWPCSL